MCLVEAGLPVRPDAERLIERNGASLAIGDIHGYDDLFERMIDRVRVDAELLGEFVDSLRSFGISESDAGLSNSVEYLLSSQNPDGSWGDISKQDVHTQYHTAWTAVDALREYDWQERAVWPESVRRWLQSGGGTDSFAV